MQLRQSLSLMLLATILANGTPTMSDAEESMSPDAKTLKALVEAGSDLTKPHDIDHWIYFRDESGARAAAKELVAAGFTVESISKEPDDSEWRLLAKKTMVPVLKDVESQSTFLEELARRNRGDYDGWETQGQE